MTDEFPTEFDVVVIGTGLPESILSAAFSRIGQKVLHIDRNVYYSGRWCSFNLKGIESWEKQTESGLDVPNDDTVKSLISEEEKVVKLDVVDRCYNNVSTDFHIGDETESETESTETNNEVQTNEKDKNMSENSNENSCCDSATNQTKEEVLPSAENEGSNHHDNKNDHVTDSASVGQDSNETKKEETVKNTVNNEGENSDSKSNGENEQKTDTNQKDIENKNETWTKTRLKKEWRKFNLDLTPKLLYCGGSMVQLLITSDIAKYCEFKTVTRMLTLLEGKLERVPCSRADVFNSKKVSMLEKRMLMKFLTSCAEYDQHPADYEAFIDRPFTEYLDSKKLTKNIKHFVQYSIAMTTNETSTSEGLANTKKFLDSLGRYGNTAFLWPLYGCGELPQAFCRLSAVFGGIYCLRMSASHLIIGKDNKCSGIITTDGKKISAKHIIIEESSVPTSLFTATNRRYLSRTVLITNKSMLTDDSQQLSLLQIPDQEGKYLTTVIELPPSSMSSPSPLYVVHITKETENQNSTPEADLQETVLELFQSENVEEDSKPFIMWSLYFKRDFYSDVTVDKNVIPDNVVVIPGPGPEIDIDCVADQTKKIFEKLMPGEDFLPRPPNPEDIIYIDDAESSVPDGTNKSDFKDSSTDQLELSKPLTSETGTESSSQSESTKLLTSETGTESSSHSESTKLLTSETGIESSGQSESTKPLTSETGTESLSPSESTKPLTSETGTERLSPSESTKPLTSETGTESLSPSESTKPLTSETGTESLSPSESTKPLTSETGTESLSPSESTKPLTSETGTESLVRLNQQNH